MKTETLEPKPLLLRKNKSLFNASLRTFDLPTLIGKMKCENAWEKRDLNARILLNKPHKQIILTALHEGTEINSFQSNDSITIQIIEGKLKFHTRKETVILEKDHILTLQENVEYKLITKAETVFILTIAKGMAQPGMN